MNFNYHRVLFALLIHYACASDQDITVPTIKHRHEGNEARKALDDNISRCKGAISTDRNDEPCKEPDTNSVSVDEDTLSPTISPVPTSAPTSDGIIGCPTALFTCEDGIVIPFLYAAETDSATVNTTFLPSLEQKMLEVLAGKLLGHCRSTDDRNLQVHLSSTNLIRGSYLQRRRMETIGLCSAPEDTELTNVTCNPEIDATNNCFVISGEMTVIIEEGDSESEIITTFQNITKQAMIDDEFLSDDHSEVVDVRYFEFPTKNEAEVAPEPEVAGVVQQEDIGGGFPTDIVVGVAAALLAILGVAYYLRKKFSTKPEINEVDSDGSFDMAVFPPAESSSFEAMAHGNLGKLGSTNDVHLCKSATCKKCYHNPQVEFVPTPKGINQTKDFPVSPVSSSSSSATEDFMNC